MVAPASDGPHIAKQKFREWDAEVTARIEAIRAERKGEGITLTRQQARALAGEWYHWFIARHPTTHLEKWDAIREQVHDALREAVGDAEWERSDPDELWREDQKLRKEVYPVLADVGETAQFLAMKRLTLNTEGRESFLYWLYDDLAAVLKKLERLAKGDYGDDGYAKRFPLGEPGFPQVRFGACGWPAVLQHGSKAQTTRQRQTQEAALRTGASTARRLGPHAGS